MSHSNIRGPRGGQPIQRGGQYGVLLDNGRGNFIPSTFLVEAVTGHTRQSDNKVKIRYHTQKGGVAEDWVRVDSLVSPEVVYTANKAREVRTDRRFQQSADNAAAAVASGSVFYAHNESRLRNILAHTPGPSGRLELINAIHQQAGLNFAALRDQQQSPLPLGSNDPYCAICAQQGYQIFYSMHPTYMGGSLVLEGGGKRKGKKKKSKRKKRRKRKRSRRPKKRRHKKTIKKRRKKKKTRRKK